MRFLDQLIQMIIQNNGSDIHIGVDYQPVLRLDGALKPVKEMTPLTKEDLEEIAKVLLTPTEQKELEQEKEIDLSYSYQNKARFRVNGYFERRGLNFALRYIPKNVPSPEDLGLPKSILKMTNKPYGLILVTGPTGCGKTTTLASLVEHINQTRAEHIITIEDPIEYIYENKKSLIKQREVGKEEKAQTKSFPQALRSALREDPDVILIGEMRDLETVSLVITAAETGHLVFSTLHTNRAAQAITRIIDLFPPYHQDQIRTQLATSLIGIVSQRLVPKIKGGRLGAFEIMISNPAIRSLILQNKIQGINDCIKSNRGEGMILLEDWMKNLLREGLIEPQSVERYLFS